MQANADGIVNGPDTDGVPVHVNVSNSSTVFGYQAIGGVTYAVTDRNNVDLTYRYLGGGNVKIASSNLNYTGLNASWAVRCQLLHGRLPV